MRIRTTLRLPKEHGAWAMLCVPFVAGVLVAGTVSTPLLFLALSVTFVFLARESLLIWRSARSRRLQSGKAQRFALGYLTLAGLTGAPLFFVYQLYWLAPIAIATLVLLAVNTRQAVRRQDRTILSEMLAIAGLTLTAPAAHYVASGVLVGAALWLWALCLLYFVSSVFYVKFRVNTINPRNKEARKSRWRCAVYHTFLLAALLVLVLTSSVSLLVLAAFSPVLIRSFWHLTNPVRQVNLRRLGWLEVIYSIVFLIFTMQTFRTV